MYLCNFITQIQTVTQLVVIITTKLGSAPTHKEQQLLFLLKVWYDALNLYKTIVCVREGGGGVLRDFPNQLWVEDQNNQDTVKSDV